MRALSDIAISRTKLRWAGDRRAIHLPSVGRQQYGIRYRHG